MWIQGTFNQRSNRNLVEIWKVIWPGQGKLSQCVWESKSLVVPHTTYFHVIAVGGKATLTLILAWWRTVVCHTLVVRYDDTVWLAARRLQVISVVTGYLGFSFDAACDEGECCCKKAIISMENNKSTRTLWIWYSAVFSFLPIIHQPMFVQFFCSVSIPTFRQCLPHFTILLPLSKQMSGLWKALPNSRAFNRRTDSYCFQMFCIHDVSSCKEFLKSNFLTSLHCQNPPGMIT